MKKVFSVGFLIATLTLLSSCRKEWDCECTVSGSTSSSKISDATKSEAEDACMALDEAAAIAGGNCELK
ncbi:MAG: hypothetical protein H6582_01415 [Crocinitomicaceae bacterium]|nr:hypothetical protein [Crocinitomicaceae bacterium]